MVILKLTYVEPSMQERTFLKSNFRLKKDCFCTKLKSETS